MEHPTLLEDVRRWIEQEKLWDDQLFAGDPTVARREAPVAAAKAKTVSPATPATGSGLPSKAQALQALYDRFKDCTRCPLGSTRIKFVFGVGNAEAQVLFVGEGPGYEEDRRGEPFVGKAGQLLDKIMGAIGLNRDNAYIANIVKCHPMQNPDTPDARGNDRAPVALEVEACSPILWEQISIIQPRFIVTLGSPSTRTLLQTTEGITKLRGRFFSFHGHSRIQVLPTYHPAALLRNPDLKKDVWTDMKLLRETLAGVQ